MGQAWDRGGDDSEYSNVTIVVLSMHLDVFVCSWHLAHRKCANTLLTGQRVWVVFFFKLSLWGTPRGQFMAREIVDD